jgi:hypothetical protein
MTALAFAPVFDFDEDDDEQTEFKFSELSARAKEHAREEYRADALDHDWWQSTYEDADTVAAMMGIQIDRKPVRLMGGGTRMDPSIWFSGFSSQGDGACFEGDWYAVDDPHASLTAVMAHAPTDERLHEIALHLAYMSERCNAVVPGANARVKQSGHYYHSGCTDIEVDLPTPDTLDHDNELQCMVFNALCTHHGIVYDTFHDELAATLRAFMDWIYRQLNDEHDWLMSDENVDRYLVEETFDEDGNVI